MSRPWTDEEIQFLLDNYGRMPAREIAARLGRTKPAVRLKAQKLLKEGHRLCDQKGAKVDLAPGDRVQIIENPGRPSQRTQDGTVLGVYDWHVLVQTGKWRESFLLQDIATGAIQVKVLRRKAACA